MNPSATRTLGQTAEILGVSTQTVKKLVDEGELVKLPLSGRTLVTVASIETMIGAKLNGAAA